MSIVEYSANDDVATIILDDNKANVVSLGLIDEFNAALDRALADDAIVVIKGRPGVFSAGFDLKHMALGASEASSLTASGARLAARILAHPNPVITGCTGHAYPMGAFMLMASDYVIGTEGDYRLGLNEVAIGITLPRFAIELTRYRLGNNTLRTLGLTGHMLNPSEALTAGLIDEIVAPSALDAALADKAKQFREVDRDSFRRSKEKMHQAILDVIDSAITTELDGLETA